MDAKKMTAVEWLEEPLLHILTHQQQMQVIGLFQQAKAMEKEQIMDAYRADMYPCSDEDAEQYYTSTYGN